MGGGSSSGTFGSFEGRVWLNTAHQGPLPKCAAEIAHAAVTQKVSPSQIPDEDFFEIPRQLRHTLARLLGASHEEIVLGNSTTYGLQLLAQGLGLRSGDEILLVENDFPATVYPWLPLRRWGVRVRFLPARSGAPDPDELRDALTPRTRVFCSSWVFSYTGRVADAPALGAVCRDHDVRFVLNGSQAVGARPADVALLAVDALVSCGFKWLCGPYATGFCWLHPRLLDSLNYEQAYWLAHAASHDLSGPPSYELRDDLGAAAYDVFCTANLSTYPAWQRSIELLGERGIDAVAAHDQRLVQRLIDGLPAGWRLLSPRQQPERSTLVFLAAADPDATNRGFRELQEAGIDVAQRAGALRLSPHVHNNDDDIDRVLEVLAAGSAGSGRGPTGL